MEEWNIITVKDAFPMLIADCNSGLELDCSVGFLARAQLMSETAGENSAPVSAAWKENLQKVITSEVALAYLKNYPNGMPKDAIDAGKPNVFFIEQTGDRVRERILRQFGIRLVSFDIESHRLAESDQLLWSRMQEGKQPGDPKTIAENLWKETRKELGDSVNKNSNSWICSCGTVNKGKYCTECGRKGMAPQNTSID